MTPEQIHQSAIRAGAAKFYPERQSDFGKSDTFLVSSGFLERFAADILRTQKSSEQNSHQIIACLRDRKASL